jgi:hypothetical protein
VGGLGCVGKSKLFFLFCVGLWIGKNTNMPFVRVGFFVVCLFVNFCTVVFSLGLQLTFWGFAFGRVSEHKTVNLH